ncbi:hypothetical protein PYW07_004801 [Mythimna separata]|uniref:Uncharacterized protein n=1 Tax=Mythimna separata TaxID=271217 RepID=A0AAD8DZB2_MYTSE|nr:hypothetical protein PYW07_004801 [Mythimna separata]
MSAVSIGSAGALAAARCTCSAAARRGRAGVRTPRAADMDLRLTRPRKRGVAAGAGARAVFTCGCRRRVQRAGDRSLGGPRGGRGRGRAARAAGGGASSRRPPVRLGAASARSSPDPAVRRAGVSPRAPGGGGEPRAARPRADAAAGRSRSAPHACVPLPAGRRRARSQAGRDLAEPAPPPAHPAPRLRPVFLWARQRDGTVQEVRCEDYDPRNRIRIARTPTGWRVIPRTEIFDSIVVSSAPAHSPPEPSAPPERRRRRRPGRPRRRRSDAAAPAPAWLAPDLESHIPSHTIAVPRVPPAPPEPTPLDNLLAVAELEFNQQRGEELELELQGSQYTFLPPEDVARDVMSFELGEPKPPDDMFFEQRKTHVPERAAEDDVFHNDMGVHKDLFETISEAHYLPELGGPHDEALLESLVEKGCEDNQILGQALDKLAHLVHGTDYVEEEDDILLGGAPVADIIDRLEQSLESPSRSSMTAAQGLLHLHHIGDHLPLADQQQSLEQSYMSDEVFASTEPPTECTLETLSAASQMQNATEVNHLEYDQNAEKRLQTEVENTEVMYTEQVPEIPETSDEAKYQPLPDQSETTLPSELQPETSEESTENVNNDVPLKQETDDNACDDEGNFSNTIKVEAPSIEFTKDLEDTAAVELVATDLSVKNAKSKKSARVVASIAETTNNMEDNLSEKSDDLPKDLSVQRRLPTPHASPRRIDIPRAPSRESDAMQSPQPSGIPAVPSSPEIFTMPQSKSKQSLFLETLLSSPSPKMYTSEVTITKQQCEPLNLGKHRKSASPTVTSCSDEIRKLNKEFGEPQEKKGRRESTDDFVKINKVFNKCDRDEHNSEAQTKSKKTEAEEKLPIKYVEKMNKMSPLEQIQSLRAGTSFNIPDPILIPKNKLNQILTAPGIEIPLMLMANPEFRLPDAFHYPMVLRDPDILVISFSQLESIILNEPKRSTSPKKEPKPPTPKSAISTTSTSSSENTAASTQLELINSIQPKPVPPVDGLTGELDTNTMFSHMLWLPYISQLEAMTACSQNMDFLKALNSSGYSAGQGFPEISAAFNPNSRFGLPTGFPMIPPMDYENRLQYAMWQEAMNHSNQQQAQRQSQAKANESQAKEMAKSLDVQNPFVHSTKSHHHQNKSHSSMSSRSSPMANYTASQRAAMQHNSFLQNMYPGMNPNMRPNMPLPGLQIPYFNPNLMGSQRSPRGQKSPTSPYFPNNNYLQSMQHSEAQAHQRSSSTGSQDSPRPRISVKSLQNLLAPPRSGDPSLMSATGSRRGLAPARRRDEPEVGSTTPLGESPAHLPPHPHDPASFHLWHPLFGK